jgi:phosphoglycerate kinase
MIKGLKDVDVSGKRVFLRVDYNVPLDKSGEVADTHRIRMTLPTLRYLLERKARLILASHLGRPKGAPDPKYSLRPIARALEGLIGQPVKFVPDCIGPQAREAAETLAEGQILLLENLRFHKGEEQNDPGFAKELASLGEIYVDDAFGCAHRAHASISGVPKLLPGVPGFLMEKEIKYLDKILTSPEEPFACILGGAKVSDKIPVLRSLMPRIQILLIGGGMAYTFLTTMGVKVGASKVEQDRLQETKQLISDIQARDIEFLLPKDNIIAVEPSEGIECRVVGEQIPEGFMGLDIGPETRELFQKAIAKAKTIFWNGPLGVFELSGFSEGTKAIARALAMHPGTTVIGGGDTVAAIEKFELAERMTHVSTGGGASLEFLAGIELPGIAALKA